VKTPRTLRRKRPQARLKRRSVLDLGAVSGRIPLASMQGFNDVKLKEAVKSMSEGGDGDKKTALEREEQLMRRCDVDVL